MAELKKRRKRRITNGIAFTILILLFAVILLWQRMVFTTPVGHTSVIWHRLFWKGERISRGPISEGLHIIFPWDKFYTYDVRLQSSDQLYEVVSRDALHLDITMTFRWYAEKAGIVKLNQYVGPNYLHTLLVPVAGSVAREVIALHDAAKLFGTERAVVQEEIYRRIVSPDYPNFIGSRRVEDHSADEQLITLEDVLIKRVILPPQLRDAIEQKLEQAQKVEEFEFRVQREALESERKAVEARGIRRFQEIVTPAISESYLRWRGIEATLKLAESNNSKVVVIGNSATGLPLILDTTTANQTFTQPPETTEAVTPDNAPPEGLAPETQLLETSNGASVILKPALQPDETRAETGDRDRLYSRVPADQHEKGVATGSLPSRQERPSADKN